MTADRTRFGPISAGALVFLLALSVRIGYVVDVQTHPGHGHFNFYLVQGVPFGDARSWHLLGESLADGHGMIFWRGRRPFYALLLALIYVWTGPVYNLAIGLNLLAGAHTCLLVYRIGARLWGYPVGLLAALWLVIDPEALTCCALTLSETVGLWLLTWHVWELVLALDQQSHRRLLVSGVLLAFSNLARTLTLPALAPYAVLLPLVARRAGWSWRRSLQAAPLLIAAAVAVVLPAMAINYWQNGIFSLSDNTALDFYAATHPDYGRWQPDLEKKIADLGLVTPQEQYRYMMRQAWHHLAEHPGLYARRVADHWRDQVGQLIQLGPAWAAALAASLVAALAWAPLPRGAGRLVTVFTALGLALLAWQGVWVVMGLGLSLAWALVMRRNDPSPLLWGLLAATTAAVSAFGSGASRLLVMEQWLVVCLALGGLWHTARVLIFRQLAPPRWPVRLPETWPVRRRWLGQFALVAIAVSLLRVGYRNYVSPVPRPYAEPVPAGVVDAGLTHLVQRDPALFTTLERALAEPSTAWLEPVAYGNPVLENGRLIVAPGRLADEVYYFPAGVRTNSLWRLFYHRGYERTVAYFLADRALGPWSDLETVFPGDLRPLAGRDFVLVGRTNANPNSSYESLTVEALALVPWDRDRGWPSWSGAMYFGDVPEHRQVLVELLGSAPLTKGGAEASAAAAEPGESRPAAGRPAAAESGSTPSTKP